MNSTNEGNQKDFLNTPSRQSSFPLANQNVHLLTYEPRNCKAKGHDKYRPNLVTYGKAKWQENRSNLVMYSKAKCHNENQSNLAIYSKTKWHDENQSNLVMYSKKNVTMKMDQIWWCIVRVMMKINQIWWCIVRQNDIMKINQIWWCTVKQNDCRRQNLYLFAP